MRFGVPRAHGKDNTKVHKAADSEKIVKENPERDTKVRVNKGVALKSLKQKALETPLPNVPQILDIGKKKVAESEMLPEAKVQPEVKPTSQP